MALVKVNGENLAVTTAAVVKPTASKVTGRVIMATFHHRSGGKLNCNVGTNPTGAGVTGDWGQQVEDKWEIWGYPNVLDFRMIGQTGAADATVAAVYWGEGGS